MSGWVHPACVITLCYWKLEGRNHGTRVLNVLDMIQLMLNCSGACPQKTELAGTQCFLEKRRKLKKLFNSYRRIPPSPLERHEMSYVVSSEHRYVTFNILPGQDNQRTPGRTKNDELPQTLQKIAFCLRSSRDRVD